jgi:hypothetical protein
MRSLVIACAFVVSRSLAAAADSVVLGQGISNSFLAKLPCAANSLCLGSRYMWPINASQTIGGPRIVGTVRAIAEQHTDVTTEYLRSVELFVLRPITNSAHRPRAWTFPRRRRFSKVRYEDTEHYAVTKEFLADPARMLERLFADD